MAWRWVIRERVTIESDPKCFDLRNCVVGSVVPPQRLCLSSNPLNQ